MGAITGKPTKEKINEIMKMYIKKGIWQFLIYPRSGCEIEYMSEEWLEVCDYIITFAAENDIDIWLYDEFNWPSGSCNGKVMTENPDYYAKAVYISDGEYKIQDYKNYADILNPDAVDCFIKNTHEVYYKRFGKYFGTVIKGIFTDEPDFAVSTWDGGTYPYTKNLDIEYKENFGRDLFEDMINNSQSNEFKLDFYNILADRYRKNFLRKINTWCVNHNIVLCGHIMNETWLNRAANSTGGTIAAMKEFSQPGIDEVLVLTEINEAEWITFGCVEAALRSSGKCGMAELFACGPSDMIPARVVQMLYLVAMFKIDKYVLAVSPIEARGNFYKRYYFNPMNYINPWFEGYDELEKPALMAAELAQKNIETEVLIKYPLKATIKNLNTDNEERTDKRLKNVIRGLIRNQIQWQFIEEDEEAPDGTYVIEITDDPSFSEDDVVKAAQKVIKREVYVLENDSLADEIFLRKYEDGSYAILDLQDNGKDRRLTLCDRNGKRDFCLRARDIYFSDEELPQEEDIICDVRGEFKLRLSKENTLRCNLTKDNMMTFEFFAENELNGIFLAIRNYKYDGEIFLDDKIISTNQECNCIAKGFSEFYKCSDKFVLSKGKHIIRASIEAISEYYFPACFICGEFACSENASIKELPKAVPMEKLQNDILNQYSGIIILDTELKIPNEPCSLKIDSSDLYTRLCINNEYLGGRITDFSWPVPPKYYGKTVNVRFEQYTTIGPIFGRVENAMSKEEYDKIEHKRATHPKYGCRNGITNVRFIRQ